MARPNRREWLKCGAAGLYTLALTPIGRAELAAPPVREFDFHHDHVIGTSLDLCVAAPDDADAILAESAVLHEIERLRKVLSKYDPTSELSRANGTRKPIAASPDLAAVLRSYEHWQTVTAGAISGQVGQLNQLWDRAAANNQFPSRDELNQAIHDPLQIGWRLTADDVLIRLSDRPLDLNALGKAYIVDRAIASARKAAPNASGFLLNLGGDVAGWGSPPGGGEWPVGIQSPLCHYDNAKPLAGLRLSNQAVASSGGYQRYYTIQGRRCSHILDPRTGRPFEGVAGATVVAADAVTANALATCLCLLPPEEGLRLIAGIANAECLVVASDGSAFRSRGLELLEVFPAKTGTLETVTDKLAEPWPDGYQVTVSVELPKVDAKRYRKPYVAVWVENDKGKAIRTLSVWGNAPKYLKDLNDWWKIGKNDSDLVKAVTRATRGPGKYELAWDGKDDKGVALPQGTYTVRVEVHREFGAHLRQSGAIECLDQPATVKLDKNDETGETVVAFKKAEKK
jgi:thiamine biosynthesis lipoprotein ApbE